MVSWVYGQQASLQLESASIVLICQIYTVWPESIEASVKDAQTSKRFP